MYTPFGKFRSGTAYGVRRVKPGEDKTQSVKMTMWGPSSSPARVSSQRTHSFSPPATPSPILAVTPKGFWDGKGTQSSIRPWKSGASHKPAAASPQSAAEVGAEYEPRGGGAAGTPLSETPARRRPTTAGSSVRSSAGKFLDDESKLITPGAISRVGSAGPRGSVASLLNAVEETRSRAEIEAEDARREELYTQLDQLTELSAAYANEAEGLRRKVESKQRKRPFFLAPRTLIVSGRGGGFTVQARTPQELSAGLEDLLGRSEVVSRPSRGVRQNASHGPTLEHVYGASGVGFKGAFLIPEGDACVIHPVASLAVVEELHPRKQRHFQSGLQSSRVGAMVLHPDGETVASVHAYDSRFEICFWNWKTGEAVSESIAFPECAAHADHHNAFSTIDRRNASPAESVSIPDCAPTQLAFSKYGDYLLLLFPLDSRPTISLLWRKADPSIQGSARDEWEGLPAAMACNVEGSGEFVVCGERHIDFLSLTADGEPEWDLDADPVWDESEVFLCLDFISADLLAAGTRSGAIVLVCDRDIMVRLEAHAAPVWDLRVRGLKLVSVGGDGQLREWVIDPDAGDFWDEEVSRTPLRTRDVTRMVVDELGNARAMEVGGGEVVANVPTVSGQALEEQASVVVDIRSVGWIGDDEFVIGTVTAEMYAIFTGGRIGIIQTGHSDSVFSTGIDCKEEDATISLAAHPTMPIFATACLDGSLRLFSAQTRALLLSRVGFESEGGSLRVPTCCGFSHDGTRLAVGFRGGGVAVMDAETLEDIAKISNADIIAKLSGVDKSVVGSGVTQVGFAAGDAGVVVHRGHAVMLHDASRLDIFGPYCGVDTLPEPIDDGVDLPDFGHIGDVSAAQRVPAQRAVDGSRWLVSVGRRDDTVIQWRVPVSDAEERDPDSKVSQFISEKGLAADIPDAPSTTSSESAPSDGFRKQEVRQSLPMKSPADLAEPEKETEAARAYEEATVRRRQELDERAGVLSKASMRASSVGSQFKSSLFASTHAVHGNPSDMNYTAAEQTAKDAVESGLGQRFSVCKSTVFPPSDYTPTPGAEEPPSNELELQWVYGYRGADCYAFGHGTFGSERLTSQAGRNNLSWAANKDGDVDGQTIVFFASAVGVVMDIKQRKQAFFRGHDGEIQCMAGQKNCRYVATAQGATHWETDPVIMVWWPADVLQMHPQAVKPLAVLKGFIAERVLAMSFSESGQYLMGIGADEKHRYAVYDWEAQPPTILFKGTAGNSPLVMACALPTSIAACGDKEIKVWGHPMLGNKFTTDVEGRRWLVGVRPLTPSWVSCMCAFYDKHAPPAFGSLVCGWPDGCICVFQPKDGDWNMDASQGEASRTKNTTSEPGAGRGSRFWPGHTSRVTSVLFLPPDRFTSKHNAPDGILLSADRSGKIYGWKIDQSLGPKSPWEKIEALTIDLADYASRLVPGAERRRKGDTWIDVVMNPLDPEVAMRVHARTMRYQGGGSGTVLVGASSNHILVLHLDALGSIDFEPVVVMDAHTGYVGGVSTLSSAAYTFSIRLQIPGHDVVQEAPSQYVGWDPAEAAVKLMPTLDSVAEARRLIKSGRLRIQPRLTESEKRAMVVAAGAFQQAGQKKRRASMLVRQLSALSKVSRDVIIVPVNSYSLAGPKTIVLSKAAACIHQSTNKPNSRFATSIGDVSVLTRTIESTKPAFPFGTTHKKRQLGRVRAAMENERVDEGEEALRKPVDEGDRFTLIGGFDAFLQAKLRRAVAKVVGGEPRSVTILQMSFTDLTMDGGQGGAFDISMRLFAPLQLLSEKKRRVHKALGIEEAGPRWGRVRSALRHIDSRGGNTRSRVPLATNDLERALAAENLTCKAEPLEPRDWTGDAQPSAAFVSCSEDGTIRVWDALDRVLVSSRDLVPANGRASNGSHDGRRASCIAASQISRGGCQWIAVGHKRGLVCLLDAANVMGACHEIQHRTEDITALQFSPTGNILAAGHAGKGIDIYGTWIRPGNEEAVIIERVGVCDGHKSPVCTLDFSHDECFLRSNDMSGELRHWHILDPAAGGQTVNAMEPDAGGNMIIKSRDLADPRHRVVVTSATIDRQGIKNRQFNLDGHSFCGQKVDQEYRMRDTNWETGTCILAWDVRAVWRPRGDVKDVGAAGRADGRDVVAVGYLPKEVKLGRVTDPFSAKEEAARRYNMMAFRCLGPMAELNRFSTQAQVLNEESVPGAPDGRLVGETHGIRKVTADIYAASVLDVNSIKIFNYPCVGVESAPVMRDVFIPGSSGNPGHGPSTMPAWFEAFPKAYRGHSSRVNCIRFTSEDRWLLSTGGSDCSILQWAHRRPFWLRWWLRLDSRLQSDMHVTFHRVDPRIRTDRGKPAHAQAIASRYLVKVLGILGFEDHTMARNRGAVLAALEHPVPEHFEEMDGIEQNERFFRLAEEIESLVAMGGTSVEDVKAVLSVSADDKCSREELVIALFHEHLAQAAQTFFNHVARPPPGGDAAGLLWAQRRGSAVTQQQQPPPPATGSTPRGEGGGSRESLIDDDDDERGAAGPSAPPVSQFASMAGGGSTFSRAGSAASGISRTKSVVRESVAVSELERDFAAQEGRALRYMALGCGVSVMSVASLLTRAGMQQIDQDTQVTEAMFVNAVVQMQIETVRGEMAHCAGRWQAWVAGRNQTKSERLAEAGLISMTSGHLRNMENFNT